MEIKALLMGLSDNVVTCITDVKAGERVAYRKGDEVLCVEAAEDIPYCHKIALTDLAEGADIIKYDESIGRISCPIERGGLVDHTNLFSVPRDYDAEMVEV